MVSAFVLAAAMTVSAPSSLLPFPLSSVRLLDGRFKERMVADAKYLKSLDPLRLLHGFYVNAGLPPKGERYGGWEAQGLEGHSLGHYLSACALMYGATGDQEFRNRVDLIVSELAECQAKRGDGFLGGFPNADRVFAEVRKGDIRSQGFDLNGAWVPWYNIHKTLAGLLDAHRETGSEKALEVLKRNADWVWEVTKDLSSSQWQSMLACEYGGMNESFASLYAITRNPRHRTLAESFYDEAVLGPLARGERKLPGRHGNTQIPKAVGAARVYEATGESKFKDVAKNLWDEVVEDHTYAMGGHGLGEHFGPAKKLSQRLSDTTAETCNTYNMLKLTDHLMTWQPSIELADFYERGLVNHILASIEHDHAGVTYFVPLRSGGQKHFSSPFDDFTCCRGTGMENHALYGTGVYYHQGRELWISQFVPSRLEWKEGGVTLEQRSSYPEEGRITFVVKSTRAEPLKLKIRCPGWAEKGMDLSFGGRRVKADPGTWLEAEVGSGRTTLSLDIPMTIRKEAMPDDPNRVVFFHGPSMLAAVLPQDEVAGKAFRSPVIVPQAKPFSGWLAKSGEAWKTSGVMRPADLDLRPFYSLEHEKYAVYFDVFTEEQWSAKEEEYRRLEQEQAELEARTLDFFAPGEMQSERDHEVESDKSGAGEHNGIKFRHAWDGGWFTFKLKVDPERPNEAAFKYWGGDRRSFDLFVDGKLLLTEKLTGDPHDAFVDRLIKFPLEMTKGKSQILVKLVAPADGWAGGLFGVRVFRPNQD